MTQATLIALQFAAQHSRESSGRGCAHWLMFEYHGERWDYTRRFATERNAKAERMRLGGLGVPSLILGLSPSDDTAEARAMIVQQLNGGR